MRSAVSILVLLMTISLVGCTQATQDHAVKKIKPEQLQVDFATEPDKLLVGDEVTMTLRLNGPITLSDTEVYIEVKKLVDTGSGERIDFKPIAENPAVFTAKVTLDAAGTYNSAIHIYSPEVHKMQDAVFYVEEKASAQAGDGENTALAAATNAITEPVVLGEAWLNRETKEKQASIRLLLVNGVESSDPNPGSLQGTFYSGACQLVYSEGDEVRASLDLGDDYTFRKLELPFEVKLDDYNADGFPDFTIGQWIGSNGSQYSLYTVKENRIEELIPTLYSASREESHRFPLEGSGFRNLYYAMEGEAGYYKTNWSWDGSAFHRSSPVAATEDEVAAFQSASLSSPSIASP
ncbi:hypothetical protein [Gorillibacterium sp. CAU 1737]|uniref:hypothetical protein n=1 Tax=Gorillibacterium sp. CAU 1737 TaxID=3140362 RepID=UPI0032612F1B